MELTQLFEQISGSDEFKEEYDRLENEKKKCARVCGGLLHRLESTHYAGPVCGGLAVW